MATVQRTRSSVSRRSEPRTPVIDVAGVAHKVLGSSEFGALGLVQCSFLNGCLTLRGTVRSYHLKQMAQTLVRDLPGVARIANRVEVAFS